MRDGSVIVSFSDAVCSEMSAAAGDKFLLPVLWSNGVRDGGVVVSFSDAVCSEMSAAPGDEFLLPVLPVVLFVVTSTFSLLLSSCSLQSDSSATMFSLSTGEIAGRRRFV